ncbi:helix-turn-helix domain-containing protein, partial [Streptomyces sp. NPDC001880]
QGDHPPAQPPPEVTALLQALRQVKESKNLSLDAFTHDTGYSRSSWNRVLKGTAFPPRAAVERLCSRRRLDKNTLLGLWDAADRARRIQEELPPTAPAPVPPTAPAPAPGTATPKPAAASPAPEPSTPGTAAPVRPAAASRSRIKTLALIAAALTALLLVGRWYSVHETKDSTVSQPETGGDNRPGDDQPVVDEPPCPRRAPPHRPRHRRTTRRTRTRTRSPRARRTRTRSHRAPAVQPRPDLFPRLCFCLARYGRLAR